MATDNSNTNTSVLVLGALGVVFGDIGTNPLYALRQCFQDFHQKPDAHDIIGILSLIFWALILVVCLKYLTFILRAEHNGEGGTLAMLALIQSRRPRRRTSSPGILVLTVLFGSALLYGDGVITPAISVLSAVEGLEIATPSLRSFVIPLSLAILVGLFLAQSRGTGRVGSYFGPIMGLWFLSIAALGIAGIARDPRVLSGLDPLAAVAFLCQHGGRGPLVLGGVVLCFSGAEALFADLSHFGRIPITLGWYGLVLPSLVLNYFGQGALLLAHPEQAHQPFFALVPHALLYPMVALATAATVIASQALISGAFSLTQQAIHMGYFPRLEILHTSKDERGQVYIAVVNYGLMIACVAIVLMFRSSEKLGGAYGLAVIGTMTITSLTYFVVLRRVWKWPRSRAVALVGAFLVLDLAFLAGNAVKILSGAWVPVAIALVVFAVFWIWTEGSARYHRAINAWAMPLEQFLHEIKKWRVRHPGTGIFLTTHDNSVPLVGKNLWLREHVRPEQILLIEIIEEKVPFVPDSRRALVENLGPGFMRLTASFGFMQHPDITRVLKSVPPEKLRVDWERLVCYLPEPYLIARGGWWHRRVQTIFSFMLRNSVPLSRYLGVPPREIIHVGIRLEM